MGVKLRLTQRQDIPSTIAGQNTYTSFVVDLPTRNKYGQLEFKQAMIQRNKDVHIGYLEYNRQNILDQSFKFLGERYGWGHSFNARDCTGFVGDVYKSFGILMPRNTGQQASSEQGYNIHFNKHTSKLEKLNQLEKLEVGDLIYIPGHVMMFLGLQNGKPYIIHDVSGLSYFKKNGEYYQSKLNGVSVTPLLPLQLNQETKYLDRIYNLKKIK
ncbi:MAG: NlpC/P60 family protein [Enterobacterales bacterium]|nr:NlpC/P60 family protein [Enterobacterales bacterium]